MSMTKLEKGTRSALARFMRQQGYVTYAGLLLKFDLNFHQPPGIFAAAMEPGKYRILINPIIDDKEALSLLIRHEILHEYLKHNDRLLKHLAKKAGLNYDELDDMSLKELDRKLKSNDIFNIAADYEISNRGYTELDKQMQRDIGQYLKSSQQLRGLVTEDDHPEWVNLPVEEMYDRLIAEREQAKKKLEQEVQEDESDVVDVVFISKRMAFDPKKQIFLGRN